MKQISLGELALKLNINKSKLAYYFSLGLIKPMAKIGRMNVFDEGKTISIVKNISSLQGKGKSLKEIKNKK